jgi:hypothetical protein
MKTELRTIAGLLLVFTLAVSCAEKKQEPSAGEEQVQKPLNPNGDSELALLMREMFDEAQLIKTQIDNGDPVEVNVEHEKILTAHATEPEKAASEEYRAFAGLYLKSIESLRSANAEEAGAIYSNVVVNCMACHKELCPGPVVKIKKLQ